jgi:hypothetical protein
MRKCRVNRTGGRVVIGMASLERMRQDDVRAECRERLCQTTSEHVHLERCFLIGYVESDLLPRR